ncbi:MAG: transposase [Nitrospiraceae bacterium]|nr:MAG: transposase [Nitrospiraceae bacterium]
MPRIARAVAEGYPHHVVQRGNNKEQVFFDKRDKEKYLFLLKKYSEKWKSQILVYCLMTNHVHLLVKPHEEKSLCKMMQGITLCYTQYVNRKYKRTGRLWESRYHSCIVDNEKYLWAVARYIEQNPVRAKIVRMVDEFPYSSACAHLNGTKDEIIGEPLFDEKQGKDYAEFVRTSIPEDEMNEIRYFTRTGRPLGKEQFVGEMENKFQRRMFPLPRGRPRKHNDM